MKNVMWVVVIAGVLILSGGLIYGGYWVAKTVSYKVFYEDMVRATVQEMVKPTALAEQPK